MADATGKTLRVVVVTPERAVLDETVDFVVLPMFDGELGVLPGRAPIIGRLGAGELKLRTGNAVKRYFIEAGFAQVRGNSVSVLTAKAVTAADVTAAKVEEAMAQAEALPASNALERANKTRARERATGMKKVAARN